MNNSRNENNSQLLICINYVDQIVITLLRKHFVRNNSIEIIWTLILIEKQYNQIDCKKSNILKSLYICC